MMISLSKVATKNTAPPGCVQGFTLVELMITVAIMVIIATIGVPSFNSIINTNRLQGPANEVLAAMNFARAEAVRRNNTVIVCKANTAFSACSTGTSDWPGLLVMETNAAGAATNVIRVVSFDTALKVNASVDTIRYNAQGFIRNATNGALNGTVRVCIPKTTPTENARDLSFASGGRLNISSVALSGLCPAVS